MGELDLECGLFLVYLKLLSDVLKEFLGRIFRQVKRLDHMSCRLDSYMVSWIYKFCSQIFNSLLNLRDLSNMLD
jgi:hypothetical protein